MDRKRVLVTGLSGVIGTAIRPTLEERYEIASLSRSGVDTLPDARNFRASITDLDAIAPAFEGVDTVVHLAADARATDEHGVDAPWESMLQNNIVGTYNVFEAARGAGVRRVISASSGMTIVGYESDPPWSDLVSGDPSRVPASWPRITRDDEPRPISLYGVSKLVGEDLARYFVATSDLSIICLRIGGVSANDTPSGARGASIYCSHADITQMVVKCIDAPDDVRFDIFYAVSNNRLSYRDIEHAKTVVGYEPTSGA